MKNHGSIPYSRRGEVWDKSQQPRFGFACWLTAKYLEFNIIKWSMVEVSQTQPWFTLQLVYGKPYAAYKNFSHVCSRVHDHTHYSSPQIAQAAAQTANLTQHPQILEEWSKLWIEAILEVEC